MKQYHNLLNEILKKGTHKDAARENMPGTTSLFGHQMRFNLSEGFPLLTTKKTSLKNIAVELIWFLKGDQNIKYLIENGFHLWTEDAFNFYEKICSKQGILRRLNFKQFDQKLRQSELESSGQLFDWEEPKNYVLGDTGFQYPALWRNWKTNLIDSLEDTIDILIEVGNGVTDNVLHQEADRLIQIRDNNKLIDQVANLIDGLKNNPLGRRHIITAWDPENLQNMALNACHAFVQFNCRPLSFEQKIDWAKKNIDPDLFENVYITELALSEKCPNYYLDCQMYQRSADVFLGVPYNIASYALFTHMLCMALNMVPGDYVHTFGDVHIYDNHLDQVNEILTRDPKQLPTLKLSTEIDWKNAILSGDIDFKIILDSLKNYKHDSSIKAKLSTGLK